MNKLILALLFFFSVLSASAQKVYFVYIQAETDQSFYLKFGEKTYSSSASGYLILPRLIDSTYAFKIGFAQNKWPEQVFLVPLNRKDHGYLLKNFGEKGWGLFDLQSLSVLMSSSPNSKAGNTEKTGTNDVSVFADILSKASDDPSLKEKTVQPQPVEETKKEAVLQEVAKKEEPKPVRKDTISGRQTETVAAPEMKKEESKSEPKAAVSKPAEQPPIEKENRPKVEASKEKPKPEAKEPVTITPLETNKQPVEKENPAKAVVSKEQPGPELKDPVRIIPVETNKQEIKKEEPPQKSADTLTAPAEIYKRSLVTKKSESSTTQGFGLVYFDEYPDGTRDTINIIIPNPKPIVAAVSEQPKEEKKFLDISSEPGKKEVEKKPEVKVATVDTPAVTGVTKNNCRAVADENDFFKLRKNMAAAEGDDDMVVEARKYFKVKCFSVAQVKNLGSLFLSDEGKYKFFDAAYNYITGPQNFASLQAELKEEYYINRFKAMLRN